MQKVSEIWQREEDPCRKWTKESDLNELWEKIEIHDKQRFGKFERFGGGEEHN